MHHRKKIYYELILAFSVCHACVWVFWLWHRTTFADSCMLLVVPDRTHRTCRGTVVENLKGFLPFFFKWIPVNTIFCISFFSLYAGTPQSLHDSYLIRLPSRLYLDQQSKDSSDIKTTPVSTQTFIHICTWGGQWQSRNYPIHPWSATLPANILHYSTRRGIFSKFLASRSWGRRKTKTFKKSCFPLSTQYIVIAIYYIQPIIN